MKRNQCAMGLLGLLGLLGLTACSSDYQLEKDDRGRVAVLNRRSGAVLILEEDALRKVPRPADEPITDSCAGDFQFGKDGQGRISLLNQKTGEVLLLDGGVLHRALTPDEASLLATPKSLGEVGLSSLGTTTSISLAFLPASDELKNAFVNENSSSSSAPTIQFPFRDRKVFEISLRQADDLQIGKVELHARELLAEFQDGASSFVHSGSYSIGWETFKTIERWAIAVYL